ncbi:hypothetical protein C8F04DRAFT_1243421 [Mycena alexandri]|uniref:Uncharacterized protein n=1 Tax=Mycena alexandri TaxID=1745969 RepID=A0AAD6RZB4_9AGAR|nr:hypothetical protein C8F04DRAFT_1243421 [Mycena alexandri]
MFDVRSITINSWWRNPSSSSPSTPLGYPWVPVKKGKPPTNVLPDEDSQQVQGAARLPHLVTRGSMRPNFRHPSPDGSGQVLEDPGYSLDCILHGQFCEFRGFNVNCTTCSSLGRRNCTWNLCADLHASFIRAHTSQRLASSTPRTSTSDLSTSPSTPGRPSRTLGPSSSSPDSPSRIPPSPFASVQAWSSPRTLSLLDTPLWRIQLMSTTSIPTLPHTDKLFSGPERHVPTVGEQNIRDRASQPAPASTSKRRSKTNKFTDLANEGEDAESGVESDAPGEMEVDADAVGTGDGSRLGRAMLKKTKFFELFTDSLLTIFK